MADKVMRALALIEARDNMGRAFATAGAKVKKFEGQLRGMKGVAAANAGVFDRMNSSAMGMAARIAGVVVAYGALTKAQQAHARAAETDRRMSRIGITGDASPEETRRGMLQLRDLSRQTALSFDQVSGGMEQIVASGRSFQEAMGMMPSVARTAQASGASVEDIANSSTALIDHMKISIEGLQAAQDALAKGGELGKFELKDAARYLPSILPAVKAIGIEGQAGLEKLVAMLQVIRAGTGTAEEAAASAQNIFAKMESEETAKKFSKFGIDLRKEMEKARKEGKDLLSVFVELSDKALKGDLSKLPQLFTDMEFARGMRALLGGWSKVAELQAQIAQSSGTVQRNLDRIANDSKSGLDRLKEGYDRATDAAGRLAAIVFDQNIRNASERMDELAKKMEAFEALAKSAGLMSALSKAGASIVESIRADREREVRQWDDDTLGARQTASGWTSARHDSAAAAADQDAATTRKELDVRRAQAARMPGNAALAAHVKRLEDKIARQESIARAERAKSTDTINAAMPRLPPEPNAPWFGMGTNYPDREGFARYPDTLIQGLPKGAAPLPPRRPAGLDAPATPPVPVAPLDGGKVEAVVKPDQITAKAEVSGEATVKVPVTITVNDGAIKGLIRAEVADQMGKVRLHSNGPGSTGTSSPDSQ